ncbi:MAG: D-alanyl-D-alanine carboxypeptidase, partial [Steroidobacteraceae bacterium]
PEPVRDASPARARPRAGRGPCPCARRGPCALQVRLIVTAVALATAGVASVANAAGTASSSDSVNAAPDLASAARTILGAGQGVYVEASDGTVLVAQAAAQAVQPASVSKVPSTLALLAKLGPDYRFETRFAWRGSIMDGALQGDLTVRGDGDISLVDEDALLVVQRLNELGIRRIAGIVRSSGSLTFDWQPDPGGVRLQRALGGHASIAAWRVVSELTRGEPGIAAARGPPAVSFVRAPAGGARIAPAALETPHAFAAPPGTASAVASHELVYRSQPLLPLLKSLNDYSNNIFDSLVDAIGGAAAVQALARSRVPSDLRDEITLADAAGADSRNRLSPRTAVRLLRALESQLASTGHALTDVLPVAGVDPGTLEARFDGPGEAGRVVGKTGTYGSYGASALVGAIRTRDHGTVYFAILDHGIPVPEARRRQDRFVRALLTRYGTASWPYHPDGRSAVARSQIVVLDRDTAVRAQSVTR